MTTPPQDNNPNDTAAQAGIEKTLSDELNKGLNFAARSLGALDEQERQTLLNEAELAYQNAIYLSEQSTTPPESPIIRQLQQLGAFLVKNSTAKKETKSDASCQGLIESKPKKGPRPLFAFRQRSARVVAGPASQNQGIPDRSTTA